jgi:hypothetical protein
LFKLIKELSRQTKSYLNRQWTKALKEQIKLIEKGQLIEKMLKFPARRELMPIVTQKISRDKLVFRDKH